LSKLKAQGKILEAIVAITFLILALITIRSVSSGCTILTTSKGTLRDAVNKVMFLLDTYGHIDEYLRTRDPTNLELALSKLLPNIHYKLTIVDLNTSQLILELGSPIKTPFLEDYYIKPRSAFYNNPILVKIIISKEGYMQ